MLHNQIHASECCPECGGPKVDGLDCWEQLGGVIAWEVEDPELAAEHFLTVASYSKAYEGSRRVFRDKAEWQPVLRTWKMTIADVYIPDRPQGAADRVRAWAAAIRSEL